MRKKLFLTIICFLFLSSFAEANTYYVDGGAGTGGTGAIDSPFDTISDCTAQIASDGGGGHTCFIRAGTYSERIIPESGADATHKNTYASYNGETVAIHYPGSGTTGLVYMSGKSNLKIIGLTFNDADCPVRTIDVFNTDGVEILHNIFDKTSMTGIHSASSPNTIGNQNLIIRGNSFSYLGCTWDDENNNCSDTSHGPQVINLSGDKKVLVEYNTISHPSNDIFGYVYAESIVRNNYINTMDLVNDYPNIPDYNVVHRDFWQGSSADYGFNARNRIIFDSNITKNYYGDTDDSHEHWMLNSVDGYDDMVLRGNIVHVMPSNVYNFGIGDRSRMYNNTYIDTCTKNLTAYAIPYGEEALNSINKNNIYYKTNVDTLAPVKDDSGTLVSSNNLCFASGSNAATACILTGNDDPLFGNYANDSFILQSGSPARNAGTYLTLSNGAASEASTTLIVDDAGFFTDGFSIVGGVAIADIIQIGSNDTVTITAIDYDTNTITIASAQTWADNAEIYWRGNSDIGAYPYKTSYALSGTWSLSGGTVTVTPNDSSLVRFVEVLENGVPVGYASTPPYAVAGVGVGTITVKIYSLYASEAPIVAATESNPLPVFTSNLCVGCGGYYR